MLVKLPNLQCGHTFINKRPGLTLSLADCELHLYVADGLGYCVDESATKPLVDCVQFGDWVETFAGSYSWDKPWPEFPWKQDDDSRKVECELEVIFRMVDADDVYRSRHPGQRRKPEVIAVSVDGCRTFIDNQQCSLFHESRTLFLRHS